jgi:Tol biopolymer transport system component
MELPMTMKHRWTLCLGILSLSLAVCSPEKDKSNASPPPQKSDLSLLKAGFPIRGSIVFQSDMDGDNEIYLLTANEVRKLTDNSWSDEYPRWSPDGTRIAFTANAKGNFDVYIMNADGSGLRQITSSLNNEGEPAWFPNGTSLAFTEENKRLLGKDAALWKIDLETRKTEPIVSEFKGSYGLSDFSPTAPLIAFTGHRLFGWDVFIFDIRENKYGALTEGGKSCRARFSKDGRRLAYVSSRADGKGDIWSMNPDGSDDIRLTERDETYDYFPAWAPDGEHIVFCSSTQNSPKQGRWSLFLLKVGTRRVMPLFSSSARDLFPDWH